MAVLTPVSVCLHDANLNPPNYRVLLNLKKADLRCGVHRLFHMKTHKDTYIKVINVIATI